MIRFIQRKTLVFCFLCALVVRIIPRQTPHSNGISCPAIFMPKLNHLLKYFIRWHFWAIIFSNLLSMVSMITSICFLPNSKMNLVTLWQNSSQFSFFTSFSVAASASLVETKSKNFSIVFSSGDLSGTLSDPSFLILFLQLLRSVLGNIH